VGIQQARALLPDVILMDIHLPGMGGDEALDVLLADPRTADIPVIAVSANAIPSDIAAALDNGFFRYVTKPIAMDKLLEALNAALARVAAHRRPARATQGVA
jgi:CheY-like chemotaxis protein